MFSLINLYILIGISYIKIIATLPLNNESKLLIDQRQSGKYNIHLSIKDVSIIEIGGNNYDDYSENDDYYYDDTMLTVKPWGMFTKPTTIRTTQSPLKSTVSPIIYVTPFNKNITENNEFYLNKTKNDNPLLLSNITNQNEIFIQSTLSDSLTNVTEHKPDFDQKNDENLGFRASQRNPFDFIHYRKVQQKPESRIFHFHPHLRNLNKRKGKKYGDTCKNIPEKALCQMRKRINSLLIQRLFTWFKRRMPDENISSN